MSSEKNRVNAKSKFIRKGHFNDCRSSVPAAVKRKLGASIGDELVWEQGCPRVVDIAALLPGEYFVVRLVRAPEEEAVQPEQSESMTHVGVALEPLAEVVRRKLGKPEQSVGV